MTLDLLFSFDVVVSSEADIQILLTIQSSKPQLLTRSHYMALSGIKGCIKDLDLWQ